VNITVGIYTNQELILFFSFFFFFSAVRVWGSGVGYNRQWPKFPDHGLNLDCSR